MVNLVRHGVDAIFGSGTGSTTGNYYRKTPWRSEIIEAIYCDATGTGTYDSYGMNVGDANGSGGPNLGDFSIETLMATGKFAWTVIYASNANVMFEVDITTSKLRLVKPGSHQLGLGNTALSARTWYHMAVTFDGAGVAFYLNGVPDGTATSSTTFANAQYGLLTRPGVGAYEGTHEGYVAYTAVWDRVLAPAEMAERARNPWGIFAPYARKRSYFLAVGGGATLEQESFRWRYDDGDEGGATFSAPQDEHSAASIGITKRLRVIVDVTGNPGSPAAEQFQLQYRRTGSPTEEWKKVN